MNVCGRKVVCVMLELMSMEALRVGAERRREVLAETMRDVHASAGLRHAAGLVLVAVGERITGERLAAEPAPASAEWRPVMKPVSDCL
jgi:hypothetical protein